MRKIGIALLLAASLQLAHALPANIEAERLAIQAHDALEAKEYFKAMQHFEAMEALSTPLPEAFYFLYAKALIGNKDYNSAKIKVEKYLELYNSNGKYYADALKLYNSAEEVVKKNAQGKSIEMVPLPIGISMSKYEITRYQWQTVMEDYHKGYFAECGGECPIENVSWDDAQKFIQKLNGKTGLRFRLPTEEEWFQACQAGDKTEYCGSDDIDAVAWYKDNAKDTIHPVGQKKPNSWGLYDMSGNVLEWTSSCYENDCTQRVNRGGSWINKPSYVRSANPNWDSTSNRFSNVGVRLAQDP